MMSAANCVELERLSSTSGSSLIVAYNSLESTAGEVKSYSVTLLEVDEACNSFLD